MNWGIERSSAVVYRGSEYRMLEGAVGRVLGLEEARGTASVFFVLRNQYLMLEIPIADLGEPPEEDEPPAGERPGPWKPGPALA